MLSDDKIKVMDIRIMADNLRMELIQCWDGEDEDYEEKIDLLYDIIDTCGSYLKL